MELKIKALSPKIGTEIPLPRFATAGAACMDLCACIDEAVTLAAGERRLVPTGIAIALPSAGLPSFLSSRNTIVSAVMTISSAPDATAWDFSREM